jgi:hypothetical protein
LPTTKRTRLVSNSSEQPSSPASPEKQIIVESGPVEPTSEVDDFEEDDEPASEDNVLSAKELLSQHTGEEYGIDYEEEEEYF